MKYRVIVVFDDEQKVVLETDDLWIACITADTIERYLTCQDVYIDKEEEK